MICLRTDHFELIHFFKGPKCCPRIRLSYAKGHSEAHDMHRSRFGDYALEPDFINGKPHWTKLDGKQGIWFDQVFKNWKIGQVSDRGTPTAGLYSNTAADCVHDVQLGGWKWWNGQTFQHAGKGAVIECVPVVSPNYDAPPGILDKEDLITGDDLLSDNIREVLLTMKQKVNKCYH